MSLNTARRTELTSLVTMVHKNERKLLKAFLLWYFHQYFYGEYKEKHKHDFTITTTFDTESYVMDKKIIQQIIREIVETGDYNLAGIAMYTHIPPDVIVDAACGNNTDLSITFWAKLLGLYVQVKPEMLKKIADMFSSVNDDRPDYGIKLILNE